MKEVIITVVEDHETIEEEDDNGTVTTRYTETSVFRFEFEDAFDHKQLLMELRGNTLCLDATRLRAEPLPF